MRRLLLTLFSVLAFAFATFVLPAAAEASAHHHANHPRHQKYKQHHRQNRPYKHHRHPRHGA